MTTTKADRVLSLAEVQRVAGDISRSTLWRWQAEGLFPKRLKLGPRRIGWRESEVLEWVANREACQ